MPFSALRGFEELIRKQTVETTPRKNLSEEEAAELSAKLLQVERGMLISVVYYRQTGYVTLQGMVSGIDLAMRILTVVKQNIPFDDILDISGADIQTGESI